ncbi:MAG: hypothetical protein UZ07_CHB004002726 [Chlorobi bacterium OLB7]|nr:MAG: hypothetical protein UZ07_CHB004002726 [Chlorobi bacterium OLB7]
MPLNPISSPPIRSRLRANDEAKKRQRADGDKAFGGPHQNQHVRAVVANRAEQGKERSHHCFANGEPFVLVVEGVGKRSVAFNQPGGNAENLDLFRGLIACANVAEVVKLAAFRGPTVEE